MPQSLNKTKTSRSQLSTLVALFIGLAVLLLLVFNRQNIYDWYRLRIFKAPANVAQLATEDTMTAYATKIYYVNHPAIQDKSTFLNSCPNNGGEKTIVLGCYHSGQAGIFLLGVNDPLLNGVEQVTAAHEILHAAYDRLNSSQRQQVDTMLMDFYQHDLHDQRILDTIDAYKQSEPNDLVNEMHSIFGTEVANLPPALEAYYKRYFVNRQQVTAYAEQYQAEFTSRQAAVAEDDAQLSRLKTDIDGLEADIGSKLATIHAEQQGLLAERDSGNISAYNAGVTPYNQLVNQYNSEVGLLQSDINQYNQLVAARNALALQEQQLSNELNASVKPISQ